MQTDIAMDAAKMWADATRTYAEAASKTWWTMTSNAAEMWALPAAAMASAIQPAAKPGPKSWYKKPAATPLEAMMSLFSPPSQSGFGAWPVPAMPMAWFAQPNPFGQSAFGWAGCSPFVAPGFGMDRMWSAMQLAMAAAPLQQAMTQVAESMTASVPSAPYAVFRTDGGHATAQVTVGAQRLMSIMIPLLLALSAFVMTLGLTAPQIA